MSKILKQDYKYYDGDNKDFNLDRNNAIIEGTIKKYEANRTRKVKEFRENLGERSDALAFYIKSSHFGYGASPVEHYFGKRMVAYLRGDEVRQKIYENVIQTDTQKLLKELKKP